MTGALRQFAENIGGHDKLNRCGKRFLEIRKPLLANEKPANQRAVRDQRHDEVAAEQFVGVAHR
jgi:hypothetical protein